MNLDKITATTKQILAEEGAYKARLYFVKNTYEKTINEQFDTVFKTLFPSSKDLITALKTSLKDLKSSDETIRIKTARYLGNQARKETSTARYWLANPISIKLILEVLEKEQSKKVIFILIGALGSIIKRYKFKDIRVYNAVKKFYEERTSKDIKLAVTGVLTTYDNPEKWNYVYRILTDKPKPSTIQFINGIIGDYYRKDNDYESNLTPEIREKLLIPLRELLQKYPAPKKKSYYKTTYDFIQNSIRDLEDGRFKCYRTGKMTYITPMTPKIADAYKKLTIQVTEQLYQLFLKELKVQNISDKIYCVNICYNADNYYNFIPPNYAFGLVSDKEKWQENCPEKAQWFLWNVAKYSNEIIKPKITELDVRLFKKFNDLTVEFAAWDNRRAVLNNVAIKLKKHSDEFNFNTTKDFVLVVTNRLQFDVKEKFKIVNPEWYEDFKQRLD